MTQRFFINRRLNVDRRNGEEPRKNPRLDLSYKHRRKQSDRRQFNRDISEDFYASNNDYADNGLNEVYDKH